MSQSRLFITARKPEATHIGSILDPFFEEEGRSTALFEDTENPGQWCFSVYVLFIHRISESVTRSHSQCYIGTISLESG